MQQRTYGNDLQDTRNYDLQGRLLSQRLFEPIADITVDERAYSYDKNSNILSIDVQGSTNDELIYDRAYDYDKLDRLSNVYGLKRLNFASFLLEFCFLE